LDALVIIQFQNCYNPSNLQNTECQDTQNRLPGVLFDYVKCGPLL